MKKFFWLIVSLIVMSSFVEYSTPFLVDRYKVSTCATGLKENERFEDPTCSCCVKTQRVLKFNVENITTTQQSIEKIKIFHEDNLIHQENFDCDQLVFQAKEKKELSIFLKETIAKLGLLAPNFTLTVELFYEGGISENHPINYFYCD